MTELWGNFCSPAPDSQTSTMNGDSAETAAPEFSATPEKIPQSKNTATAKSRPILSMSELFGRTAAHVKPKVAMRVALNHWFGSRNPSQANQRHRVRQAHHHRSGNFVVPTLFVAVPTNPEETEQKHERRESSGQPPDQRHGKGDRSAITPHHLQFKHDPADGRSFPCPHPGEVRQRDRQNKGADNHRRDEQQRDVEKCRAHSFPKTSPRVSQHYGQIGLARRLKKRRGCECRWRNTSPCCLAVRSWRNGCIHGRWRAGWSRVGRELRRLTLPPLAPNATEQRGDCHAQPPQTNDGIGHKSQYRHQVEQRDQNDSKQEGNEGLLQQLKAKRPSNGSAKVFNERHLADDRTKEKRGE